MTYIVLHPPLTAPFSITWRYMCFEQSLRVRIGNITFSLDFTQLLFVTPPDLLQYLYHVVQLKFGKKKQAYDSVH